MVFKEPSLQKNQQTQNPSKIRSNVITTYESMSNTHWQ